MSALLQHPELASAIQGGVPLVARPFAAVGEPLGLSEDAVLSALRQYRDDGRLREISAVLEGESFGWESALVAGAIPAERLEAVAAIVGAHPNVTHNYERTHRFNLWFTLAVPPQMGLQRTLDLLERESDAGPFVPLPRTRTFKIAVRMDPKTKRNRSSHRKRTGPIPRVDASPRDQALFRLLQTPLPFVPRPFEALAATQGLGESELLAFANAHEGGAMRRYAATFHHRKLGVGGNVMSAWQVPEERHGEVGEALAALGEVSHCYARTVVPEFPYPIYAMIHGPDVAACTAIAQEAAARLGVPAPAMLESIREFKKCRLRYFLPELDSWWNARAAEDGSER